MQRASAWATGPDCSCLRQGRWAASSCGQLTGQVGQLLARAGRYAHGRAGLLPRKALESAQLLQRMLLVQEGLLRVRREAAGRQLPSHGQLPVSSRQAPALHGLQAIVLIKT